jgi:hypothetical protein
MAAVASEGLQGAPYWVARAEEARVRAEQMHEEDAQRVMLGIALAYDLMARRADARESAEKAKSSPGFPAKNVSSTMVRATLEEHLRLAERHVALGCEKIARQSRLLAELERDGHDTATARTLLQTFEGVQETLEVERARLGHALADLG